MASGRQCFSDTTELMPMGMYTGCGSMHRGLHRFKPWDPGTGRWKGTWDLITQNQEAFSSWHLLVKEKPVLFNGVSLGTVTMLHVRPHAPEHKMNSIIIVRIFCFTLFLHIFYFKGSCIKFFWNISLRIMSPFACILTQTLWRKKELRLLTWTPVKWCGKT